MWPSHSIPTQDRSYVTLILTATLILYMLAFRKLKSNDSLESYEGYNPKSIRSLVGSACVPETDF